LGVSFILGLIEFSRLHRSGRAVDNGWSLADVDFP
jgi:hypothetical protein